MVNDNTLCLVFLGYCRIYSVYICMNNASYRPLLSYPDEPIYSELVFKSPPPPSHQHYPCNEASCQTPGAGHSLETVKS